MLRRAFRMGRRVLIGLTANNFVKKLRKPHEVDSYPLRKMEVEGFLREHGFSSRARITTLHDPYGPTVRSPEMEAIVVSRQTEPVARRINKIRRRKGLRPLRIVSIGMVLAEDFRPISSSRIRKGIIDREGYLVRRTRTAA